MAADVGHAAALTGLSRIGAPGRLLLATGLQGAGQPVLGVFHLHHPQLTQRAGLHQGPGLAHHRVAGVGIGHAEQPAAGARALHQVVGLGQGAGQRLVADDVDAGVEKGTGRRVVQVVGGNDGHHLDAVGPCRLGPRHLPEIGVHPVRRQPLRRAAALGPGRVGRGRGGQQLKAVIQPRGDAVHRADEGALAAAHQAPAQPAHGARPSSWRRPARSTPPSAKSSKARSATRMMWRRMKSAPSRAPSSGCLRQHSHSSTAQPA